MVVVLLPRAPSPNSIKDRTTSATKYEGSDEKKLLGSGCRVDDWRVNEVANLSTTHRDSVDWRVGPLKGQRGRKSNPCSSAGNTQVQRNSGCFAAAASKINGFHLRKLVLLEIIRTV
ncbi:hypothetical protein Y032_0002g1110 [Ancylostoma ceylanicum]|uniref:Uncharacterized protein n=1 Tax=Ancylostoma ceylanicum TaxID=53326 RepID=A0A016W0K8_9BILA|nr:hypothetical protein Y032_0002g1110 [Ancylostoma ceylanicum]